MNIVLAIFVLFGDTSDARSPVFTDHVDVIEINHFYSPENAGLIFDCVIYYNLCKVPIETKNGLSIQKHEYVVVDWFIIPQEKARAKLTKEEFERLEREYIKKVKLDDVKYNPPFVHSSFVPTINYRDGKYHQVFHDPRSATPHLRKVVAESFKETWTTFDPEVEKRVINVDRVRLLSKK